MIRTCAAPNTTCALHLVPHLPHFDTELCGTTSLRHLTRTALTAPVTSTSISQISVALCERASHDAINDASDEFNTTKMFHDSNLRRPKAYTHTHTHIHIHTPTSDTTPSPFRYRTMRHLQRTCTVPSHILYHWHSTMCTTLDPYHPHLICDLKVISQIAIALVRTTSNEASD
jgi:hypothetical protein